MCTCEYGHVHEVRGARRAYHAKRTEAKNSLHEVNGERILVAPSNVHGKPLEEDDVGDGEKERQANLHRNGRHRW